MNYGTYDGLHSNPNQFVTVVPPEWRPTNPSIYDDEFDGPTLDPKWTVEAYYPLTASATPTRVGIYNSSLVNLDVEPNSIGVRPSSSFCIFQQCPQNVSFYIEAKMQILPRTTFEISNTTNGIGPWIYIKDSVHAERAIVVHAGVPETAVFPNGTVDIKAGYRSGSGFVTDLGLTYGATDGNLDIFNALNLVLGISYSSGSTFAFTTRSPNAKQTMYISSYRNYTTSSPPYGIPQYFGIGLPPLSKVDWVRVYTNPPDRNLLTLNSNIIQR